jgi:hypothetical protein
MSFLTFRMGALPVPVAEMVAAAAAQGISEKTLHRAKKRLSIRSLKKDAGWVWHWGVGNGER